MTDESELQRLIAVANSEGEARAELAGCGDRLHQVQGCARRAGPTGRPSLRAALEARRWALGTGGAQ